MYNVMLVDDETIVKVALRTMIPWEELGFPICATASDGVEALALVEKLHPDIIITDLKMPNMDGLQLIKELNNRKFPGKILVASNHGEYELVREALVLGAVDYILKISMKTDDLISQLKKSAALIQSQQQQETQFRLMQNNMKSVKNAILKDFFNDPYYNSSQLEQLHSITLHFTDTCCYLFYITFEHNNALYNEQRNQISVSFIENIILDILETIDHLEIVQVEARGLLLLVSCDTLKSNQIHTTDFANRIIHLIKMYISVTPIIVHSGQIRGYAEAKQEFERCKKALQFQFYEEKSIVNPDEMNLTDHLDFENVHDFSLQMIQSWKQSGVEAVSQNIRHFLAICKSKQVNPDEAKKFMVDCLLYIPLCDSNITIGDSKLMRSYIDNIATCKRLPELLSMIELIFQLFSLRAQPIVVTQNRDVKQAIDYIHSNYQNKITLSSIARHVNLSENYLSRIFKEEIGQSIIHYINALKMEKAAELILQGDTYIKEISAQIGIHDQFYFTRLFKKHFGVNPSEYKDTVQTRM